MEQTQRGYDVYNYSSNSYVVRMTYKNGVGYDLPVPPEASVGQYRGSDPVEAVVYDAPCSQQLATVPVSGPWAVIYIDESGAI